MLFDNVVALGKSGDALADILATLPLVFGCGSMKE